MDFVLRADLSSVRTPKGGDRVYKDECIYSFQTPVSEPAVCVRIRVYLQRVYICVLYLCACQLTKVAG